MPRSYILSIFFILISCCTFASELAVPTSIKVLKVNGKTYSGSFFESEEVVDLRTGSNILILQYKELFEDYDNDDHTTVSSSPFVAVFSVNTDEKLSLRHVKIVDEKQAKEFAEKPTIKLVSNKGIYLDVYTEDLEHYQNQLSFEKLAKNIHHLATQRGENLAAIVLSNDLAGIQVTSKENVNALTMLEYWWQQASEEQKANFLKKLTREN